MKSIALLASLWLALPASGAQSAPQEASFTQAPAGTYGVLVRLQDQVDPAELPGLTGVELTVGPVLFRSLHMHLVFVPASLDWSEVQAALEARQEVLWAQLDHPVSRRQTLPNDPNFSQLWAMNNTGQSGGTVDADIDAVEAWDLGTGSADQVIAIVDGGAQTNHTDLLANRWENAAEVGGVNGVDDDGNGYVDDKYGWNAYGNNGTIPSDTHGTHVAGTAGARGNNSTGVVGVNWTTRLMHVAGSSGNTSTVMIAYGYVADQKALWLSSGGTAGANIVVTNSSFGVDNANCASGQYPAWNDAYDEMGGLGILSCAATANNPSNIDVVGDVPTGCSSPYLIAVTATDRNDVRNFAAYGLTTIDLAAPGESIRSTVPTNSYSTLSGTSMATPHVTGSVAFLHSIAPAAFQAQLALDPGAAALQIKAILLDTVDPIPALATKCVSGGRLNLFQAALAMQALDGLSGVRYCGSPTNSSGLAAQISGAGSNEVAQNDLTLTATDLPVNQFAYFLAGTAPDVIVFPGGSQGVLCIGGGQPIARLSSQIQFSGTVGEVSIPVDLTVMPMNPTRPVVAGESWYFQCWFRDQNPTSTSNFSDGLRVDFQ
ncbi:MAG: S8 family serine peptidase [Planctomycetota bacterium]